MIIYAYREKIHLLSHFPNLSSRYRLSSKLYFPYCFVWPLSFQSKFDLVGNRPRIKFHLYIFHLVTHINYLLNFELPILAFEKDERIYSLIKEPLKAFKSTAIENLVIEINKSTTYDQLVDKIQAAFEGYARFKLLFCPIEMKLRHIDLDLEENMICFSTEMELKRDFPRMQIIYQDTYKVFVVQNEKKTNDIDNWSW